jgi:hypothetical protein
VRGEERWRVKKKKESSLCRWSCDRDKGELWPVHVMWQTAVGRNRGRGSLNGASMWSERR